MAQRTSKFIRRLASGLRVALAVYLGLALYLYVFQARYLYFPERAVTTSPADIGLNFEAVWLNTTDGEKLAGWFIPAPAARGTLLYLHGNGGNIGSRLDQIAMFHHQMGLNVFIIDYRGYGASSGKPNEEGTYQDALAAWHFLTQQKRIGPERIILFGESLGGSIAAWLAARHKPAGLILYASFTSIPEMAQTLYPMFPASWLSRYRYDTLAALNGVKRPVLILHSRDDEIIPFSHGQALLHAAHGSKRLVELRGGHNDALQTSRETYATSVGAFLEHALGSPADLNVPLGHQQSGGH